MEVCSQKPIPPLSDVVFDIRVPGVVSQVGNGGVYCRADGGGAHLCMYYILHTNAIDLMRLDATLNFLDHGEGNKQQNNAKRTKRDTALTRNEHRRPKAVNILVFATVHLKGS